MSPLVYPSTRKSISSGASSSPSRFRWIKSTVRIMRHLGYHSKNLKVKAKTLAGNGNPRKFRANRRRGGGGRGAKLQAGDRTVSRQPGWSWESASFQPWLGLPVITAGKF